MPDTRHRARGTLAKAKEESQLRHGLRQMCGLIADHVAAVEGSIVSPVESSFREGAAAERSMA
jgi:hypothetical protein